MNVIFTSYAEWRCEKRKILKEEALDAVQHADRIIKRGNRYFYRKKIRHGVIEVCAER